MRLIHRNGTFCDLRRRCFNWSPCCDRCGALAASFLTAHLDWAKPMVWLWVWNGVTYLWMVSRNGHFLPEKTPPFLSLGGKSSRTSSGFTERFGGLSCHSFLCMGVGSGSRRGTRKMRTSDNCCSAVKCKKKSNRLRAIRSRVIELLGTPLFTKVSVSRLETPPLTAVGTLSWQW